MMSLMAGKDRLLTAGSLAPESLTVHTEKKVLAIVSRFPGVNDIFRVAIRRRSRSRVT